MAISQHLGSLSAAAGLVASITVAGCATQPAAYAVALSNQDPKWQSPQCKEIRVAAANYAAGETKTISWAAGLVLGPYGLGLAAASKEHQEKQRKLFAREIHIRCSSLPLPKELQTMQSNTRKIS